MAVDLDSTDTNPVPRCGTLIWQERYPLHSRRKVARLIVATDLEVTAVLAKAEREHLLLDDVGFEHGVYYRLHVHIDVALGHSQDAIRGLRVEEVGLLLDTAEGELESVEARVICVTEMDLVLHHEALVHAAFTVALVKAAPALIVAGTTLGLVAVEDLLRERPI